MPSTNKIRKLLTKNIIDVAQATVSINVPGKVLTDDISAAWIEVGEGNILRVEISADTFFAFDSKTTGGAVDVTTSPAVKLKAGVHLIICQDIYVRASTNPVRIELLQP